jgi:predicted DNA repair protein MutK
MGESLPQGTAATMGILPLKPCTMSSSLLVLLDDIATILDDVAVLSKVAAQKTAGVLGDDLALNAQQVAGVTADRELPVVWAVCKGSLVNKVILVPTALLISVFIPWAVTPLLMVGGAYLCLEGFEKLAHTFLHGPGEDQAHARELLQALTDPTVDVMALEQDKIKGAIRTDFVLSAEIIAITLGTVQNSPWMTQLTVLSGIALLMTLGVYGFVAGIVKIDDAGLYLSQRSGTGIGARAARALGRGLLAAAPWLMKALAVVGTAAMFLVGGGILVHGLAPLHHAVEAVLAQVGGGILGSAVQAVLPLGLDALTGVVAGALVYLGLSLWQGLRRRFQ